MCEGGGYRDFVVRIEEGRKRGRGEDSCVHSVCKVYILVTAKVKAVLVHVVKAYQGEDFNCTQS